MPSAKTQLTLHARQPTAAEMDGLADWIVVHPAGEDAGNQRNSAYEQTLLERRRRQRKTEADKEPFTTDLPNAVGSRVAFAVIKPDIPEFELLTLARKLAGVAIQNKAGAIGVAITGFNTRQRERITEALWIAILAGGAEMPAFKREPESHSSIRSVDIYGVKAAHGFQRARAEAEGNALARHLSVLPPNKLTPTDYVRKVRPMARRHGWRMDFYDTAWLRRKGAGAFLAVVQGSPVDDAGILRLRYVPAGGRAGAALVLVGKGVCYDTGGTNLKPARYMYGMHGDMQGSAVALGILYALSELRVRYPVDCWLALAMNHVGPKAYKPNDVVTAADGTSIEVVHTDAEGRMLLADTLILALRQKPRLILDFATLTSDCRRALGTAYSGVFTNRGAWLQMLIETGRRSGERVWPFPMDEDFDEALESDIADIKQCPVEDEADHILAACFLKRFVGDAVPWIHMDLASGIRKTGLAHVPTGMTGFGVRYTLSLLLDAKILEK